MVSRPSAHSQMGHPVGLQGQKALEEEERLDIALAGRVALEHGVQVGLGIWATMDGSAA